MIGLMASSGKPFPDSDTGVPYSQSALTRRTDDIDNRRPRMVRWLNQGRSGGHPIDPHTYKYIRGTSGGFVEIGEGKYYCSTNAQLPAEFAGDYGAKGGNGEDKGMARYFENLKMANIKLTPEQQTYEAANVQQGRCHLGIIRGN